MNKKQLMRIVESCVAASIKKGKLEASQVKRCLNLLKSLSREDAIFCLEQYQRGLRRTLAATTLTIESVTPLSRIALNRLVKSLARDYAIYHTETILNPSLLGGVRLRIGDVLLDNSVAGKIAQLGERVSHG